MKNTMLKMVKPLVAAITGGTRSVASAIGRFALVATAICATAAPLSSQAATLTHRWSFTSDCADSVGGTANGSAFGKLVG